MSENCYDDILPDDGRLFDRVKLWSEFCEKYKTDFLEREIGLQDYTNCSSEEDSIECSSDSEEFEDNSIPDEKQDPEFDVQKVLDNTLQIMHTREDKWRRNGMTQAMISFDVNTAEKVQNWIKQNDNFNFSNHFSKSKKPMDKKVLNEEQFHRYQYCSDDESLQSVNTAKYILSNRKKIRSTHHNTTTIKQFCFNKQQSVFNEHHNRKANDIFQSTKSLAFNSNVKEKSFNKIHEEKPLKLRRKIKLRKRTMHYNYFESSSDSSDQSVSNIVHGAKLNYIKSPHKSYKNFNKGFKIEKKLIFNNKKSKHSKISSNRKVTTNLTTSYRSEIDFNINSIINSTEINRNQNNKYSKVTDKNRSENLYTNDNNNSPCNTCGNGKENKNIDHDERIYGRTTFKQRNINFSSNLKRKYNCPQRSFEVSNESAENDRGYTSSNISSCESDTDESSINSLISRSRKRYFGPQISKRRPIFDRNKKPDAQSGQNKNKTALIKLEKIKRPSEIIVPIDENSANNFSLTKNTFVSSHGCRKGSIDNDRNRNLKAFVTENSPISEKNISYETNESTIKNYESSVCDNDLSINNNFSKFHNTKYKKNNVKVKKLKWQIDEPQKISEATSLPKKYNLLYDKAQTPRKYETHRLQEKEKLPKFSISNKTGVNMEQQNNKSIKLCNEINIYDKKDVENSQSDIGKAKHNENSKCTSFQNETSENQLDINLYNKSRGVSSEPLKGILVSKRTANSLSQTPNNSNRRSIQINKRYSIDSISSNSSKISTKGKLSSNAITEQHVVLYDPMCRDDTIKPFGTGKIVINETLLKNKIGLELMRKFLNGKKTYKQVCDSDSTVVFVLPNKIKRDSGSDPFSNKTKRDSSSDCEEDDLDNPLILQLKDGECGKIVELLKYKKT